MSTKRPRTKPKADAAADTSAYIQNVRLEGCTRGLVRNLRAFKKSHHSVPDEVNSYTSAFLGKLCAEELADEAEAFFQKTRASFGYKRKEITLDVSSPAAALTTPDFTLEWTYALNNDDPSEWMLARALCRVQNAAVVQRPEFDSLFAGLFDRIVFSLTKGAEVHAVIDAVESLEDEEPADEADAARPRLTVDYPSDCRRCTLRVDGVPAEAVFDGGELSMVFPRAGSPRELIEAFARVREAFSLSKSGVLAGLL